jgi:hypothetical protein
MGWVRKGAAAAATVMAGGVAVARTAAGRARENWPAVGSIDRPDRWQVVTVNRPGEEVVPDGRLPEPLARLGEGVEVRLRPAPGNRGIELAARLRSDGPHGLTGMMAHLTGDDPRLALRSALRQTKQLAETGELLSPARPPSTHRTLLNRPPLNAAIRRARAEGP